MNNQRLYKLLLKHERNALEKEEQQELMDWYEHLGHPSTEDTIPRHKKIIDGIWRKLTEQLSFRNNRHTSVFRILQWSVAACFTAIVCITVYWLAARKEAVSSKWTTIANIENTIRMVTLSDQSVVYLKKGASLSYNDHFNEKLREVNIQGEAFFEVAHDAHRPFIVQAGGISTKVLGTAFNVEAYTAESAIRVSLLRGRVQVTDSAGVNPHPYLLQPGNMVLYDKSKHQFEQHTIKVEDISAWTKGKIVFNDIPLTYAFRRLEDEFGVAIHYNEATLNGKLVSGQFERSDIETVLKSILFVYRLNYKRQDKGFRIY